MRCLTRRRLSSLIVCTLAIAAFGFMAGQASAATAIGTSAPTPTITGPFTLTASGVNIICMHSLNVTFSSSIAKTAGANIATINSGTISACNPATVTGSVLSAITIGYRSFTGTLPNITGMTGSNSSVYQISLRGSPFPASGCVFGAAANALAYAFTGVARSITAMNYSGAVTSANTGCPTSGTLRSSSLTGSAAVALTLI
jgi:hypothetical protein